MTDVETREPAVFEGSRLRLGVRELMDYVCIAIEKAS